MKFFGFTILLSCLLFATFSQWFIITAYKLNQQYIINHFCENKSNPSVHCNGNCYLNKQLEKDEKPASPLNTKSNERFEIQLFCSCLPETIFNFFQSNNINFNLKQDFVAQQFIKPSYHPPQI